MLSVIKSFRDSQTENLYYGKRHRFDTRIIVRAIVRLDWISEAKSINDLRIPPSNRLESLTGNRTGQHSIRINNQWRICFIWDDGAEQVEITDYH